MMVFNDPSRVLINGSIIAGSVPDGNRSVLPCAITFTGQLPNGFTFPFVGLYATPDTITGTNHYGDGTLRRR